MQFFILFIVGAVILGAGAMLSPAWTTAQPRIGTAATFALALIVGGAVFWAALFGWDTLVIDYLLFALVSAVVLGGTFSQAQERAEARGEELLDADQGWPGPRDLLFFAVAVWLCALPLISYYLPLGESACAHALMTLAARDGGSFTALEPFFPSVSIVAAPGFHALAAYLSQQLNQSIALVHLSLAALLSFMAIWACYDLGAEWRDKYLGRALALAAMGSGWLLNAFFGGEFPRLMAWVFGLAFILYALRYARHAQWLDMVGAGLMLGAALYTDVGVCVALLLGYGVLAAVTTLYAERNTANRQHLLGLWLGVPAVALLGTAPWWVTEIAIVRELLQAALQPDEAGLSFWWQIAFAPAVGLGAWATWSRERRIALWLVGWWGVALTVPAGSAALMIPTVMLSGAALLWCYDQLPDVAHRWVELGAYAGLLVAAAVGGVAILYLLPTPAEREVALTRDDVAALRWVALYTADDARLLTPADADLAAWSLVLAERQTPFLAPLPQTGITGSVDSDANVREFWAAPDDNERIARQYEYIFAPDANTLADVAFLREAFRAGEAAIYAVSDD